MSAITPTSHDMSRNTTTSTVTSIPGSGYRASHHSLYPDTKAVYYGTTMGISKDTEHFLNSLWHDSLYQYRAEITKIIVRARMDLASSPDVNATKAAITKTMEDLKDNSSRYFDYHRNAVYDLIDQLPPDQAQAATDHWKSAHEHYKEYTRSFYTEVMKTMRVMVELNIKVLKQCGLLEKEIDGIYDKALSK